MKQLKQLIAGLPIRQIVGSEEVWVRSLALDSRQVEEGGLFFAQRGLVTDGHLFILKAIWAGAAVVVCESLPDDPHEDICWVQVPDVADCLGMIAARFYDFPSRKMKVIGVTGTNGKTTIATVAAKLFEGLGYRTGLISTVQNKIGAEVLPSTHTTPNPIELQKLLATMHQRGCSHVFMEVSSHAIHQRRILGLTFFGGVFSNISHDHLDYHHSFDEYLRVKKRFFDELPDEAFALSNRDDRRGEVMLQNTKAAKHYYSLRSPSEFKGVVLSNSIDGLEMLVHQQEVHFRMSGLFNAYNLLAVFGIAVLCGEDAVRSLAVLSNLQGAAGRFETYRSLHQKILGIVDYAHTPDALLNILSTIRQFGLAGRLITVVGCGGDRDKSKRSLMAEVACVHSDRVVLTSDNPRTEDPEAILDDMEKDLSVTHKKKVLRISDRREAIKAAVSIAAENDVVLIAGKGHETYQEVQGVRRPFDDKEILLEMFHLFEK